MVAGAAKLWFPGQQGLCRAWKGRHERACEMKTPAQRRKWAKPYIGKDTVDSSIVVDMSHPTGFNVQS